MSNFEALAAINVNDKIEKKGRFSYLSWAWAVDTLLRADPAANWAYSEPVTYPDGTMMVFCTVTAFTVPRTMQLPVIDSGNKPIKNPNAFQINTAMQRCLVKAIALHGLGLYIYAGEDVPEDVPKNTPTQIKKDSFDELPEEQQQAFSAIADQVRAELDKANNEAAYDLYAEFKETLGGIAELQAALRSLFNSAEQSSLAKEYNKRKELAKAA